MLNTELSKMKSELSDVKNQKEITLKKEHEDIQTQLTVSVFVDNA